jgi:hypothetical protein
MRTVHLKSNRDALCCSEIKLCIGCGHFVDNPHYAECTWCKRNRDRLCRKGTWGGYVHDLKLADGTKQYGFIQHRPSEPRKYPRRFYYTATPPTVRSVVEELTEKV